MNYKMISIAKEVGTKFFFVEDVESFATDTVPIYQIIGNEKFIKIPVDDDARLHQCSYLPNADICKVD